MALALGDIGIAADAVISIRHSSRRMVGSRTARALRLTAACGHRWFPHRFCWAVRDNGKHRVRGERVMRTGGGRIISSTTGPSRAVM